MRSRTAERSRAAAPVVGWLVPPRVPAAVAHAVVRVEAAPGALPVAFLAALCGSRRAPEAAWTRVPEAPRCLACRRRVAALRREPLCCCDPTLERPRKSGLRLCPGCGLPMAIAVHPWPEVRPPRA